MFCKRKNEELMSSLSKKDIVFLIEDTVRKEVRSALEQILDAKDDNHMYTYFPVEVAAGKLKKQLAEMTEKKVCESIEKKVAYLVSDRVDSEAFVKSIVERIRSLQL